MDLLTLMQCHWDQWDVQYKYMKALTGEKHGQEIQPIGWYLHTSQEHYRCHVIYVKKTNSKCITDTVWFKHKYITQPKATATDHIVKAINDLTCALKGKNNVDSLEQIKALQKLEELLTHTPTQWEEPMQAKMEPQVTFEPSVKPPAPTPRVESTKLEGTRMEPQMNRKRMSISDAEIEKRIQKASIKRTIRAPLARIQARNQRLTTNKQQILRERAQLIYDEETGQYLKYRQLLNNPKYATQWARSAANKFGWLAQGVGTRTKSTNTIHFIEKSQVPKEQIGDITYGSFHCDYKPNKEEKERRRFTVGAIETTTQTTLGHQPLK
jgi:hypothetical protein